MSESEPLHGPAEWFHRGDLVVVARVPRDRVDALDEAHGIVQAGVRQHAGAALSDAPGAARSFAFTAPGRDQALVFFFQKLIDSSPRAVKAAVEAIHERLDHIGDATIEAIGAMPNWHVRAHEAFSGGSPDAAAQPIYPEQVASGAGGYVYRALNERLNGAARLGTAAAVPVAILDTQVDFAAARRKATALRESAGNRQLVQTLDWLERWQPASTLPNPELAMLEPEHTPTSGLGAIPDHALFVAGLIHGIAPTAPLTIDPVLSADGRGDLSSLLVGLQRVLARKASPQTPQIVNLSLGFLPHPARLPSAWYGLPRPHDVGYRHTAELFDAERDERWATAHRAEIDRCVHLLETGLAELGTYLALNNCLVVAAAGNDSQALVEARGARLAARLPARLGTVLGVAATTRDGATAAAYSNMGDESELGDHVATFGGLQTTPAGAPEAAVIGIYSGDFPNGQPNETGWAAWSGTSFATALVSGIASTVWAADGTDGGLDASGALAALHAEARAVGPYVAALRTPAIEVHGAWQTVGSGVSSG